MKITLSGIVFESGGGCIKFLFKAILFNNLNILLKSGGVGSTPSDTHVYLNFWKWMLRV